MKQLLIEPLKARAVTICPDFWSDPYRNISYLGLSVSFVDADFKSFSVDLFCRPFVGVKSSELLLKVSYSNNLHCIIEKSVSLNYWCRSSFIPCKRSNSRYSKNIYSNLVLMI